MVLSSTTSCSYQNSQKLGIQIFDVWSLKCPQLVEGDTVFHYSI